MIIRSPTMIGIIAASLGLPLLSQAQGSELARDNKNNFNNGYSLAPAGANTLQGSPFLLPQWVPATLRLAPDRPSVAVPLKYDVYRQELRIKRAQGDSIIVPLAQVREFSLSTALPARRFVCYPAAVLPAEVGGACAEVLADGPHVQLLKFVRKAAVKQAGEGSAYASNSTVNVLEEQQYYYLRWPANGHLTALRLKRASLEQALAGQPAALAALKARRGSLSSEADVAAAVTALDPLLVVAGH
ncbi:MAG: hypothetical protein ACRYG7_51830 [Janthinobacterium lividum]